MKRKWIVAVGCPCGCLALTCAITWLLSEQMQWDLLHSYLVSINVVTYLAYVLDKIMSQEDLLKCLMIRVLELVLHPLAHWGGTPGAVAATLSAKQKIGKEKDLFVLVHLWICISQDAVVTADEVYR